MNKHEHFERWIKFLKPIAPDLSLEFNEERGFYLDPRVNLAYEAWLASPKTRPTEPSKITKEQLAAMKADTSDIVDNLRGIYPGIADAYPVTPLMLKAADEIERLRRKLSLYEGSLQSVAVNGEVAYKKTDEAGEDYELVRRVVDNLAEYINKNRPKAV
jgi:hypothetical protein